MKLAFSTNAYTRYPLIEAMKGIRRAGFEGVEILADTPHAYPPEIDAKLTGSVIRARAETGLVVSNVNCNCSFGYWRHAPPEPYFEPSLISPNATYRADRTAMILKTLDFAKAIGADAISITSGRTLGGMPPSKAAGQFAESMRPLLDRAEALGINIGIECEPGLFLEWAAELREWVDRLGSPRFGANLDIGHSVVMGESVPEVCDLLAGRIWNLHVEDLPGRKHYHTIPGAGTFDWALLRRSLEKIGYDRFLTVELYTETERPQEAAEKSFRFLRDAFGPATP